MRGSPTTTARNRWTTIVPIVVHHSETGWNVAVAFEEVLDVPADVRDELGEYLPRLTFVLDDLTGQTGEALQSRAMSALGRAVLWCLRDARKPGEILRRLERWAAVVRDIARPKNGAQALHAVFRYIWDVSDMMVDELQETVLSTVGDEVRDAMTTTADRLRAEGRAEGERHGRAEGERHGRIEGERTLLLRQLTARFGELPPSAVARVNAAGTAELEAWAERILVATTLAMVLGDA